MKILQVCRQYHPCIGGVERFVADLSTRLIARGHTVQVATLDRCWHDGSKLSASETVNGVPVQRLPFVGGPLFFAAPGIGRLVKEFDIIHVHNTDFFLDYLSLTRFSHGRPLVVSTHGGFFHTPDYARIKRVYFKLVTARALRAAAAVIPNSAGDERQFGPHARRTARIDNALDFNAFARAQGDRVSGRLITVGRLSANKNVSTLLKTFAEALALRSDLTLVVVGGGSARAELESQSARLKITNAVRWTGEVSDEQLCAELAAAEIFVSASRYEGFGLALLEAMAAGVIPVVNKIEAFREVIADGQDGFLVNYLRPGAASQTLLRVAGLPLEWRAQLSAQAKIRASQFDWAEALPKFEEVYRTVLAT